VKALVTGGTGFLGSYVVRRLVAEGHEITVLRRESSATVALDGLDVGFVVGDVRDRDSVRRALEGQDAAIHAAGGLTGDPSRPESYETNVAGTRNVVDACLDAQVERLLHVSSVSAIGIPPDQEPIDESFRFNLQGTRLYYNLSRHRAEEVVRDGVARGLDAVIVNPASLWGRFGDAYRGAEVLQLVRDGRWKVTPGGVCIAHVDDVAAGIVGALGRGVAGERYILGGDNLTYGQWVGQVAAALGVEPRSGPGSRLHLLAAAFGILAQVHPRFHASYVRATFAARYAFYDSSKAVRELGYTPRSFDAILEECVRAVSSSTRPRRMETDINA
jgi:dihydroflavonol-4-reductase